MINADLSVLDQDVTPFFNARLVDGQPRTAGAKVCLLGQKLPGSTPQQQDGVFVEWNWDGLRLVVQNDRYGMYPLFYSCHKNEIWISPSISQVLKGNAPKDFDDEALAVLLRIGHPIANDTPFRYIHALPPHSTLTWESGCLQIVSQERAIRRSPSFQLSFDEAVDQFIKLFDCAIQKRLPIDNRFIFPLTGGRDSRHILFALEMHGVKPSACVTVEFRPPTTGEDIRIAQLVAEAMQLPHFVIPKTQDLLPAIIKETYLSNLTGAGHIWAIPLAIYLKNRTHTLYDGLAGDVLSAGFMTDENKIRLYREGRFEDLAQRLLTEAGRDGFNKALLKPSFQARIPMDAAIARLALEIKVYADATNPMQAFIFWNRTRRCISQIPFAIMSHIPVVHCPYLDHALYDFLTGVDQSYLLNNRLHDTAIHRAYPKYADRPFENRSAPILNQRGEMLFYQKNQGKFFAFLLKRTFDSSLMLRKSPLYLRTLLDMIRGSSSMPWYLAPAIHCIALTEAYYLAACSTEKYNELKFLSI